jgi:acetyl-CoA synthetase
MPTAYPHVTAPQASASSQAAYATLAQGFEWQVPAFFNITQACCRRWAAHPKYSKNRAVVAYSTRATSQFLTFFELQQQADCLSRQLACLGVQCGDRVAIVLPQCPQTAVAYMAVLQMGAVAVPLSQLFGPQALAYRLQDSAAVVALGDAHTLASVAGIQAECPKLLTLVGLGRGPWPEGVVGADLTPAPDTPGDAFVPVATRADDPAVLIYTSGTTGNPKGALIPHRALLGNLTGFLCSQNGFGFDWGAAPLPALNTLTDPAQLPAGSQAVFWSPADWAWTGGLMDALLPSLFFGRPIVGCAARFDPELALTLMRDCAVTHSFLFPTALKALMKAYPGQPGQTVNQAFGLRLQGLMSAGEAVGEAVFAYCRAQLGVTVNEMFGQTEINYIVGNCAAVWTPKAGSMGRAYPGHRVAVIDEDGHECPVGEPGDVAVHRQDSHGQPDPVFFLGYWGNDAATRAKFTGEPASSWCRTGDLAVRDADGHLWYQGRSDDVFKSAGYRIGPGEIENCLLTHPAVANAAVVPKPDAQRGALVKAFVVLTPEYEARRARCAGAVAKFDAEITAQLQAHVKDHLAPYEYPKDIEFLDALPMTTTGKVQRRVLRLREEARSRGEAV